MGEVLELRNEGLYCSAGDFYIDPVRKVHRAVITHGHADHARPGMGSYLAHTLTIPVLRFRLGRGNYQSVDYGVRIRLGSANLSLHPAGHIPGSAQVRVDVGGEIWVVSGDYKREHDEISTPFEPVQCHTFISESTFALPIFRWPAQHQVSRAITQWWSNNRASGILSILVCYALGKAQRVLKHLDPTVGPIFGDPSIVSTTSVLRRSGVPLPSLDHTPEDLDALRGALVLATPGVLSSGWLKRVSPASVGYASGWMTLRKHRKRGIDTGFIVSDHVDWPGLISSVRESCASRVIFTHGYTSSAVRYFAEQGLDASSLGDSIHV